ncbi:hypothetical protein M413DRAFT_445856 [Hebeloma cylindrosporum]|uniref:TECPR1-like DysF domain-containing protein n=1 Tax=Hebeloma cylindrosporum TaxID=76867 RepID=A0A0C3CC23_HEBCY|nr:hypothetical protein M413DRAFT_445856 [Hebeloma cylindrosporum h7]
MAALDYIDIPIGATRLRSLSNTKNAKSHDVRPAPKITTSIPNPSPPPSPTSIKRRPSILSSTAASLTSPSLSLIPQLMLSASLPPLSPNPNAPQPVTGVSKGETTLLSSRDPLSLPIMSTNFKRFVSIIGPVFWLQDRVEEIILWKTGPARTLVWMAAYSFICFFPRILLLMPHIVLIGVILATYPYPSKANEDPISTAQATPTPQSAAEGSVPWQANIQGIQNLMGAVADLHDLVAPHLYHLRLNPQHISSTSQRSNNPVVVPRSPYTPHLLALLSLSFFPLLFIIHLPLFPIREVCLVVGLVPFVITHPYVRAVLLPMLWHAFVDVMPFVLVRMGRVKNRAAEKLHFGRWSWKGKAKGYNEAMKGDDYSVGDKDTDMPPLPLSMVLRRVMDDDRLSDECWNSEMREVQLWENERFGGPVPSDSPTLIATTMGASSSSSSASYATSSSASGSTSSVQPQKGWSKQNLRPGERSAWTRGRDGWSGVGVGGYGSLVEGGEVSSNLTFSLAPGWSFVESEDWRKDVRCAWSGCGGDFDGWVYTNDAWIGARGTPYISGGGSVTRRRRWVRRVWYDPARAGVDG